MYEWPSPRGHDLEDIKRQSTVARGPDNLTHFCTCLEECNPSHKSLSVFVGCVEGGKGSFATRGVTRWSRYLHTHLRLRCSGMLGPPGTGACEVTFVQSLFAYALALAMQQKAWYMHECHLTDGL